jgi:hypothetical protein
VTAPRRRRTRREVLEPLSVVDVLILAHAVRRNEPSLVLGTRRRQRVPTVEAFVLHREQLREMALSGDEVAQRIVTAFEPHRNGGTVPCPEISADALSGGGQREVDAPES